MRGSFDKNEVGKACGHMVFLNAGTSELPERNNAAEIYLMQEFCTFKREQLLKGLPVAVHFA